MIFLEKKLLNAMKAAMRVAPVILAATLAGCGGGGNESGDKDNLVATPNVVIVEGLQNQCAVGKGPDIHVYGGQPPYKLAISIPDGIVTDKKELRNSGDAFTIYFINGFCMENSPITIEDDMGRLTEVLVTNKVKQ